MKKTIKGPLAILTALACIGAGWGAHNPSGDIQAAASGAIADPNSITRPGGQAGAAVDWNGYAQTDSTRAGVVYSEPLWCPAGSATAPAYTFTSDPNTGIYDVSAGVLGVAAGGTQRATFSSAGITSNKINLSGVTGELQMQGNTVYESDGASTYLSPSNDTTGSLFVYTGGAERLGLLSTGSARFSGNVSFGAATQIGFATRTQLLSAADGALQLLPNGGAGVTSSSLTLGNATSTGGIRLQTGNNVLLFYAGDSSAYANLYAGTMALNTGGTASSPTLFRAGYATTGLYLGLNTLGISTNGVAALTFDASQNATFANTVTYRRPNIAAGGTAVTVTAAQSGSTFSNQSQTAQVTYTVPTCTAALVGLHYRFWNGNATSGGTGTKIQFGASDSMFYNNAGTGTNRQATTATLWAVYEIECVGTNTWSGPLGANWTLS